MLSHELRTPLNAVMGWTQILLTAGLTDPTAVRALASIKRNAKTQQRLVEDLLDVSRIVTGKFPLERNPVDLTAAVTTAVETMRPAAVAKNVRMTTTLPASVQVHGDGHRLQQVAMNILSNAVKFSSEGGQVDVALTNGGGFATLTVRDSGEGVPAEVTPHIFNRFRQGDSSSTRAHGGLGLGLAIARHIVEAHGGTIEARSEGKGHGGTPFDPRAGERSQVRSDQKLKNTRKSMPARSTRRNGDCVSSDASENVALIRRIWDRSYSIVASSYSSAPN